MTHAHFLKVTAQEKRDGRMADVLSFTVCRCGERFPTDHQLDAHLLHPATPQPKAAANPEPVAPQPALPLLATPL